MCANAIHTASARWIGIIMPPRDLQSSGRRLAKILKMAQGKTAK
jgi:hypothetical protein